MDVLAGDRNVLHVGVAARREVGEDALHELLRRGGAGGEADDLVPRTSPSSSAVSPSTRAASAPAARATSTSRFAFELVGEPMTRMSVPPRRAISFTASWRFCVA